MIGKLIYIPLENLWQRYTVMMNEELSKLCDFTVYPQGWDIDPRNAVIGSGEFLDIHKTCEFKALQLQMISQMFNKGEIQDGDVFLIADMFFPGLESIKYMSELQGIDIHIYGFNHAGRADYHDFVRKLGSWSDTAERSYHQICTKIFVGSEYHKKAVIRHFKLSSDHVVVTGIPLSTQWIRKVYWKNDSIKRDYIIWPHRPSREKGIDDLVEFAQSHPEIKIIITSCGNPVTDLPLPYNVEYKFNLSKAEYYFYMSEARWYLSTAYQENFGYTLQEAMIYGCNIIVPNQACYSEMVPKQNLYNSLTDIIHMMDKNLTVPEVYLQKWDNNSAQIINYIRKHEDSYCRKSNQ